MRLLRVLEGAALERGPLTLALLAVITLIFAGGYVRLGWTNDPEVITLEGSEALELYRAHVERWGSDELIVLAYEVEDAFAPARLEQLRSLTDDLLDLEHVGWVSSLDTAFRIDTGPFGPFPAPLVPDDTSRIGSLRRTALESPFVRDVLVSSDGRVLLIAVQLEGTELGGREIQRGALRDVRAVLARPEYADLRVHLAGSPVFNDELARLNQRDNALFTPIAIAVIAVLLSLLFRSALATVLALAVVGASLVWTLGLMGWLGIPINITTSLLPPLLMVIAVADAVHILSAYGGRLAEGEERALALRFALREVLPSCFWTSATTAVGFASLLLVQIESVRTFGTFAVAGVLIAFFHSALLLPALMVRLPLERSARRRPRLPLLGACERVASRPWIAGLLLVAALAAGAAGLPRIEVATHDGEFFRPAHPINRAYRFIEGHVAGVTPFEVEVRAPRGQSLRSAAGLQSLEALQAEMARKPELDAGVSLADLLHGTSPGLDVSDDAAVERALFLLETLAPGEVERFAREDGQLGRVSARAMAMTSARSEELIADLERSAARLFPAGWQVRFTGLVPVFSQMEQYLVEGQLRSYGLAVVGVGLALLALFRSLRMALLALAANLAPLALLAAVMGFAGIRLDVVTIMVASVALGIIVDDTIHLVQAFRHGLAAGKSGPDALRHGLELAGRPIVVTSLILVCGFSVLTLSDFQPTVHFGLLVGVAVAGALLADLLVLPAGLLLLARARDGVPLGVAAPGGRSES